MYTYYSRVYYTVGEESAREEKSAETCGACTIIAHGTNISIAYTHMCYRQRQMTNITYGHCDTHYMHIVHMHGNFLFCLESKSKIARRSCQLIIDSRGVRSCSNFLVIYRIYTRKTNQRKLIRRKIFRIIATYTLKYPIYIDTPFGNDTDTGTTQN